MGVPRTLAELGPAPVVPAYPVKPYMQELYEPMEWWDANISLPWSVKDTGWVVLHGLYEQAMKAMEKHLSLDGGHPREPIHHPVYLIANANGDKSKMEKVSKKLIQFMHDNHDALSLRTSPTGLSFTVVLRVPASAKIYHNPDYKAARKRYESTRKQNQELLDKHEAALRAHRLKVVAYEEWVKKKRIIDARAVLEEAGEL